MVRYAAFISYSHHDRRVATWLHRAIESFRVPDLLVGTPGKFGLVPRRLAPVFRDRDDLSVSADLSASVAAALAQSDALIVICSPAAANSRWVDEEVRRFRAANGDERVFAFVVAGEPGASALVGRAAEECLPLALRRAIAPDGTLGELAVEPMAADARRGADGRRAALIKLVCGLLGVPLDALVHREHARRQRHLAIVGATMAVALLGTGALAWTAIDARDAARAERAEAEGLVGFMLGDLRGRLERVGRLDLLDAVAGQALGYYARRAPSAMDADTLARQAKALHLIGDLRMRRGDYAPAAQAFARAAATTAELLQRAPNDGERVFDHAQSVFWIGNVALAEGRTEAARTAFARYAALADRLVAIDPDDHAWRAETGYAQSNLGAIDLERRDADRAQRAFRLSVDTFDTLVRRDPGNADWRAQAADSLGWLADAERMRGAFAAAVAARSSEAAIYRSRVAADADDTVALRALAWSEHAQAELALDRGAIGEAVAHADAAAALGARLIAIERDNVEWLQVVARIEAVRAEAALAAGDLAAARRSIATAGAAADRLIARNPSKPDWRETQAVVLLTAAMVRRAGGEPVEAQALARRAVDAASPGRDLVIAARARRMAEDGGAAGAWWRDAALLAARPGVHSTEEACVEGAVARARGDAAGAERFTARLVAAGYRRPWCQALLAGDAAAGPPKHFTAGG